MAYALTFQITLAASALCARAHRAARRTARPSDLETRCNLRQALPLTLHRLWAKPVWQRRYPSGNPFRGTVRLSPFTVRRSPFTVYRSLFTDETYEKLKQGLDNERIVDLLMVISFYCGVVRLLAALQIDVEEDYEKYLKEFPLPG